MPAFEYKVKIQAKDSAESRAVLTALFDIKKAVTNEDLLVFAGAIKKNPKLVKKAKMFL
jgi:hypothetical protein